MNELPTDHISTPAMSWNPSGIAAQMPHTVLAHGGESSGGFMHWALFRIISGFFTSIGHRLAYASPMELIVGVVVVIGIGYLLVRFGGRIRRSLTRN